jgi:hypothetical protein
MASYGLLLLATTTVVKLGKNHGIGHHRGVNP